MNIFTKFWRKAVRQNTIYDGIYMDLEFFDRVAYTEESLLKEVRERGRKGVPVEDLMDAAMDLGINPDTFYNEYHSRGTEE